ncbi:hypothetical protein BGX21_004002 [Mortierella sp. AD011]|nr:hypothetical protein BGX20_004074 [Mortierella sp. AD010]KAF9374889.1 hypothetical protein BGX21_004002 [Mortierella sp. AD011]
MKVKKILSRCSLERHEDKYYRCQRSIRMESLLDEDAGVVFWEDFCDLHDWPKTPNATNIHRYIEVFVNDKEMKINRRRGLTKGDKGYCSGHKLFIKPVLRLKTQLLNAHSTAAKPAVAVHASPTPPNKSLNTKIHADDTPQASTSMVNDNNNNNKRPMSESDTNSEYFAEDSSSKDSSQSSVSTFVVSPPSKSPHSSHGRLMSSPATTVSSLRQGSIPQLLGPAHGKASSVSHSNDPSRSDDSTFNTGGLVVAHSQFKAQEFNIGLSRGSKSDAIEYNHSRAVVQPSPPPPPPPQQQQQRHHPHQQQQQQRQCRFPRPQQRQRPQENFITRPHPLAIPEIILLIVTFLPKPSFVKCLRLNRQWYLILLPKLWNAIFLHIESSAFPDDDDLDKHLSLVKELRVFDYIAPWRQSWFPEYLSKWTCPFLSELEVNLHRLEGPDSNSPSFQTELIRRHQSSLKKLSVSHVISIGPILPWSILPVMAGCTRLEELTISELVIGPKLNWMGLYKVLFWRLKALNLSGRWFSSLKDGDGPEVDRDELGSAPESKIQELHMQSSHGGWPIALAQLILVLKSPNLVRLEWISSPLNNSMDQMPVALFNKAMGTGQRYKRLAILSISRSRFSSADLRDLVQGLPALTEIDLSRTNFDQECWRVLKEETPQSLRILKRLELISCAKVTTRIIHDILCSIPNLEVFSGDYVKEQDLLEDPRPWVCLGLKSLSPGMIRREDETVNAILSQLSQLTLLQKLQVWSYLMLTKEPFNNHPQAANNEAKVLQQSLQLNQGQGLERLKTLKYLKQYSASHFTHWTEAEARWVLEHWAHLQTLSGVSLNSKAKDLLRSCYVYA